MPSCATVLATLAVAVAVLVRALDAFSPLAGIVPAMHVGAPWGVSLDADVPDLAGKTAIVTGCNMCARVALGSVLTP